MKKLAILKNEYGDHKRFINPLLEHEWKNMFMPENIMLLDEHKTTAEEIRKIPLADNGYVPLIFNAEEACFKYVPDDSESMSSVSLMLYISGYLMREKNKKIKNSIKNANIIEWSELLFYFSSKHGEKLKNFLKLESSRDNFFEMSDEIQEGIYALRESMNKIVSVKNDIKKIIGNEALKIINEI